MISRFATGLAVVGMIVCAGTVQAQPDPGWRAVVTPNPYTIPAGGTADQRFTVSISDLITASIVGDSISVLPGVSIVDDGILDRLLSGGGPITVIPGTPYVGTLDLAIPAGTPSFVGDIEVFDEYGYGNNELSSLTSTPGNPYGNFRVTTSTSAPESSTGALLGMGILSCGRLLLRRRRSA